MIVETSPAKEEGFSVKKLYYGSDKVQPDVVEQMSTIDESSRDIGDEIDLFY